MTFSPPRPDSPFDPWAVGRDIGGRVPLGLPERILVDTVREAVRQEVAPVPPAIEPRPRFWPWWLVYAFWWMIPAAIVDVLADPGSALYDSTFEVISFVMIVAAVGLGILHASRRRPYNVRLRHAVAEAERDTESRRQQVFESALVEARRSERLPPFNPIHPQVYSPQPRPRGVGPQEAEELAAEWMRFLGAVDAEVTRYSGDGGVDVISSAYIAQVKNLAPMYSVPVAQVRELAGVAAHDGRRALFFTSGSYSAGGVEFADRAGIALFIYRAEEGDLIGANALGSAVRAQGLDLRD
ncbi:hypothetical protein GCM10010910_17640 [Microbacterium nanhaiense]|uniref:Restriction endonuclease type IV Mrr domain-containing protein n=1 Tax=Microbacterium nanhaiense TaxID=1301026 RepID=A0ABQ2N5Q3_9MICO|nr:restriction endonuclease [Microbacterium nanhaiense]GGO63948.1 hypothetical protein GCM10010910_17640 [Microbacterium nanhaiense]